MRVYCETRATKGILVVNQTSADPGIKGVIPIPMDFDHISICKVEDKKSQIYRQVRRFIQRYLTAPLAPIPRKSAESEVVFQDHKYDGQLVLIELSFFDDSGFCPTKQIGIILNISFGQIDEVIKYRFGEAYIRFGVKHGKLSLALKKGIIPLAQRGLSEEPKENWQVRATGIQENPVWEFEARGQSDVLGGSLSGEELGVIDLSDTSCIIKAIFKVQINANDLKITAQEGAWKDNDKPQVIETKRRAFFKKVVEPKLKDYLSKMVLQYDSTVIS